MRPRILDLFCCAGGAAMGYHRAGFEVIGVDIEAQPRYPFEFHEADALTYPLDGFDAIHASPPCQDYSRAMRHLSGGDYPRLIEPVRDMLQATGLPWVIENVPGAPLVTSPTLDGRYGVELCGTGFGLRVYRHRLFETNWPIPAGPGCSHTRPALNPHRSEGREAIYREFGRGDPEKVWAAEMGVEWMARYEVREAIPPVYTEWIGRHLIDMVAREEAA